MLALSVSWRKWLVDARLLARGWNAISSSMPMERRAGRQELGEHNHRLSRSLSGAHEQRCCFLQLLYGPARPEESVGSRCTDQDVGADEESPTGSFHLGSGT
jgi:hypothetical protein